MFQEFREARMDMAALEQDYREVSGDGAQQGGSHQPSGSGRQIPQSTRVKGPKLVRKSVTK